jgi:hypothetical protein
MMVLGASLVLAPSKPQTNLWGNGGGAGGGSPAASAEVPRAADATPVMAAADAPVAVSGTAPPATEEPPSFLTGEIIACLVAARLVVCALASILIGWVLVRAHVFDPADDLLSFVVMVVNVAPTATTIVVISRLIGVFPREMARIVVWEYLAAVVTLPLLTSLMISLL